MFDYALMKTFIYIVQTVSHEILPLLGQLSTLAFSISFEDIILEEIPPILSKLVDNAETFERERFLSLLLTLVDRVTKRNNSILSMFQQRMAFLVFELLMKEIRIGTNSTTPLYGSVERDLSTYLIQPSVAHKLEAMLMDIALRKPLRKELLESIVWATSALAVHSSNCTLLLPNS